MWLFSLCLLALLLWFGLGAARRRLAARRAMAMTARIRGAGKYAVDVVGESHYRQNFVSLKAKAQPDDDDDEWFGDALLKLENANPHDGQAVAVFVDGLQVGYLSRSMARDFRSAMARDGLAARNEFAVGARLYWGGDEGLFSVTLDLPMP